MSQGCSILIVDDESNLRRSLSLILQRAGYSVTAASGAQEAYQFLLAGAFDLVFLDLKMPETNGMDLLPEIRRMYPEMPVVILTAHATLESAIEAVRQGASDYLLKPIDPQKIISRAEEVIRKETRSRRRREIVGEMQNLLLELGYAQGPGSDGNPFSDASRFGTTRVLQRGSFTLDLHARYLTLKDRMINLSPTAFDYLVTLMRHSPETVTYETLVVESQGFTTSMMEARDIARWYIHELRKAIEKDTRNPAYIITVRGVGYRLVP
jgi:DNA-binding response OmpR family regulator